MVFQENPVCFKAVYLWRGNVLLSVLKHFRKIYNIWVSSCGFPKGLDGNSFCEQNSSPRAGETGRVLSESGILNANKTYCSSNLVYHHVKRGNMREDL